MQERNEKTRVFFAFFFFNPMSFKKALCVQLPSCRSGSSLLSSRCVGWRTNLGRKQLLKSLAHTPPGLFCFPFQQGKILGSETAETSWLCLPRLQGPWTLEQITSPKGGMQQGVNSVNPANVEMHFTTTLILIGL